MEVCVTELAVTCVFSAGVKCRGSTEHLREHRAGPRQRRGRRLGFFGVRRVRRGPAQCGRAQSEQSGGWRAQRQQDQEPLPESSRSSVARKTRSRRPVDGELELNHYVDHSFLTCLSRVSMRDVQSAMLIYLFSPSVRSIDVKKRFLRFLFRARF